MALSEEIEPAQRSHLHSWSSAPSVFSSGSARALPQIAARMKPQTTALVVAAREPTPDAVDALAKATDATASRWPVEDVFADVYAAREAAERDAVAAAGQPRCPP